MQISTSERELKYQRETLEEFLRIKHVDPTLQTQILHQMEHWWSKKSVFDEQQLLQRLPPKHRKQLLLSMYQLRSLSPATEI